MQLKALVLAGIAAGSPPTAWAQFGGFGGPAIFDRGAGPIGSSSGLPMSFRVYGSLEGAYTNGLTPVALDAPARLPDLEGYGGIARAGVAGYVQRPRHDTSVSLSGEYNRYRPTSLYNQYGARGEVAHSRRVSPRTTLYLSGVGGTNVYSGTLNFRFTEEPVAQNVNPALEMFDNRYNYLSVAMGAAYQKSARWTFSAEGGAFGVDRRSSALADGRGAMAGASAVYAVDSRTSIGAAANYGYIFYPARFGETRYTTVMALLQRRVTPQWTFTAAAGVFRSFTERLGRVELDPLVARLTGQSAGLEVFSGESYGSIGEARLTGRFQRSQIEFTYSRAVHPGNGLFLTSLSESGAVHYNYAGGRNWAVAVYGNYTRMKALTQAIGIGEYRYGGASFNRRLNAYLSFVASVGAFDTGAFDGGFQRARFMATAGIRFAPAETPLRIF